MWDSVNSVDSVNVSIVWDNANSVDGVNVYSVG